MEITVTPITAEKNDTAGDYGCVWITDECTDTRFVFEAGYRREWLRALEMRLFPPLGYRSNVCTCSY